MGKAKNQDSEKLTQLSEKDMEKVKGGVNLIRTASPTPLRGKKKGNVEYGWKVEEGES